MSIYNWKIMKISIKSAEEINKMRIAGKLAAEVLEMIEPYVVPGVSINFSSVLLYIWILSLKLFKNFSHVPF